MRSSVAEIVYGDDDKTRLNHVRSIHGRFSPLAFIRSGHRHLRVRGPHAREGGFSFLDLTGQ